MDLKTRVDAGLDGKLASLGYFWKRGEYDGATRRHAQIAADKLGIVYKGTGTFNVSFGCIGVCCTELKATMFFLNISSR